MQAVLLGSTLVILLLTARPGPLAATQRWARLEIFQRGYPQAFFFRATEGCVFRYQTTWEPAVSRPKVEVATCSFAAAEGIRDKSN